MNQQPPGPWLPRGSAVAVFCPCGPPHVARTRQGLSWLEEHGWRPLPSPLLQRWLTHSEGGPLNYLAGTDEERLADIEWALRDAEAEAAWAVRGGYGLTRILPQIDAGAWTPRLVIGFSDLTALLWKLSSQGWSRLLHAPNLQSPGLDGLLDLLERGQLPHYRGERWVEGEAEGRLAGGNLCVLASLAGTSEQFRGSGAILFLEDVNEAPYRLDRYLTQLLQSGACRELRGVVLGDFEGCGESMVTLRERLEGWGVPVLAGLPCGHGQRNQPLPLGLRVALRGDRLDVLVSV